MHVRAPRAFPKSWHDEDTILGDFLRAADKHRKAEGRDLNLAPFTEESATNSSAMSSTTATMLAEVSSAERGELLDQATLLGVELLRGGKPSLVQKS
jgi:hypothetical protein